jgi:GrpB-like predicted nucleotidyltransferase (UPF0157 family)
MDPKLFYLVGLRGVALALSLAGQQRASDALYTVVDAYEAGKNVDDHMQAIADKLKSRPSNADDWADVTARIEADSDRLQRS